MKKVLIVLGFAMCASFAMAQNSKIVRQHEMPKKADYALQAESAKPVDYKASVFTKTPGDVLGTFTFSASESFTIGTIGATDVINDTTVGATHMHGRTEPIFTWRRIADTNVVKTNDFAATYGDYLDFHSAATIISYMGADNDVQGNDGFMMISLTEEDGDNNCINTYFQLPAVALGNDQMIDVQWRQLYRKYYDQCFLDYKVGNSWKTIEVNVTGIDCEVTGLASAFYVAAMPIEVASLSSLELRFRVFAEGGIASYGYGWLIDDVQIVATPLDRWRFTNLGYLNGFYGMQPQGFSVPLSFAAYGRNTAINNRNNVTLDGVHAYDGQWDATPFISRSQSNMTGMSPATPYLMTLDESGYMAPNMGFDDNTYFEQAVPDYYSYYGTPNLPSTYGKVGLPTSQIGFNQYALQFKSGNLVYELDTMAYTVTENMEITARDSSFGLTVPGYRWGLDNGLIPSRSEFAYQFTTDPTNPALSGYVTAGGRENETHQYADGYMVIVRYNTPSVIPTDAVGNPWRIRGLEFVTSTKLTSEMIEGALVEPVSMIYRFGGETLPSGQQVSDTGFYYINTGVDDQVFEVGAESAPLELGFGATLPDQPYYAYNILFPEQPELEPNHMYRFGYTNRSAGARFAVASTSYIYRIDDSTQARYTYNEEYAPYYNQVAPSGKIYDVMAQDPVQSSRGSTNHNIWGWNIDNYPMIRVIVGPKLNIPSFGVFGECSGADDTLYTIVRDGGGNVCGVADSATRGTSPTYYVLPGAFAEYEQTDDYQNFVCGESYDLYPHRVITDILLDGNSVFNDTNIIEPVEYNFYWEGHTPNDQVAWAPALVRNYYGVTIRNIQADHRLSAVTEWRALGLGEVEDQINMTLAPNPANSMVRVDIAGFTGKADCSIIDMSGRVVLNTEISEGNNTISLNGIPAGAYFVRVTNPAFSKVEKLIVR